MVLAARVASGVKVPERDGPRSSLKADSSLELSVQVRSMLVGEVADALRLEGAVGGWLTLGVVVHAGVVKAELPAPLKAWMR